MADKTERRAKHGRWDGPEEERLTDMDLHIAGRVRLARVVASYSQEDLAKAMNRARTTIQKWEGGKTAIGAGQLYELARVLAVDVEYFFAEFPMAEEDSGRRATKAALMAIAQDDGLLRAATRLLAIPPEQRRAVLTIVTGLAVGAEATLALAKAQASDAAEVTPAAG